MFEHDRVLFDQLREVVQRSLDIGYDSSLRNFGTLIDDTLPAKRAGASGESYSNELSRLLHTYKDKECSIPRDRIFSILPLYRSGDAVPVDYELPDDELAAAIPDNLREPTYFCSVAIVARSLLPQSAPLGSAFMNMDVLVSDVHWGPLKISSIPQSKVEEGLKTSLKPAPCYSRTLEGISYRLPDSHPYSDPNKCKIWVPARKLVLSKVTIVGLPESCSWKK